MASSTSPKGTKASLRSCKSTPALVSFSHTQSGCRTSKFHACQAATSTVGWRCSSTGKQGESESRAPMLPVTCVTSVALSTICRYSPLGSAVGLTKQAGELVAVAFPTPKTGYKNPMAYGAKPTFTSEVTTKYFVKKVRAAAESTCEDKKLMPYYPNAPRNRPRQTLTNIAGKRYGVHPTTSTERYKGQSQVRLADADPESRKPWKTTNQVFQASAQPGVTDVVGLANAGISSDIARRLHKTQGIYDS